MRKAEIGLNVTAALGGHGALHIAATVYWPDEAGPVEVVAFAFPGGGYARSYYDLHGDGLHAYSQAEHHVAGGWVFVACDHLGAGESSLPPAELLSIDTVAAANAIAVEAVLHRLARGTLVTGLETVADPLRVGIGQSMGGGLLIAQQAHHRSFDAIAVLGYSPIHTVLPTPPDVSEEPIGHVLGGQAADKQFRYAFHWDDVNDEIVTADITGFPFRRVLPSWGSATFPGAVASLAMPGCLAAEAGEIEVPVFIGVGERDLVPEPHAEPAAYPRAANTTVFVLPRAAHMHNFATTRQLLWRRLHVWAEGVRAMRV